MFTRVAGKVKKDVVGPTMYQPPDITSVSSTFLDIELYLIPYSIGSIVAIETRNNMRPRSVRHTPQPMQQAF